MKGSSEWQYASHCDGRFFIGMNKLFTSGNLRLYAVTDRSWLGQNGQKEQTLYEAVESALKGGVTMVQLREKTLPKEQILLEAKQLLPLCHSFHVPLIIDDDVDICLEAGADGVHVGQSDMAVTKAGAILGPDKIIGATAHNAAEAIKAEKDGADYLGCGAAFGSDTKKDAKSIDRKEYQKITAAVHIPVCAIGGINQDNILELQGYGLKGAAIVSGIFAAPDIEAACRELLEKARQL